MGANAPTPADPFEPLSAADRNRGVSNPDTPDDADLLEMLPCPRDVPPVAHFRHARLGSPSAIWVYLNAERRPVMVAARYDYEKADGSHGKQVLPWTHGRRVWTDQQGRSRDVIGWHCRVPLEPRLLFGLDHLNARPDATVLVCEGEKAACAAATIFPELVCTTSQGGSGASQKSDWTPLQGRRVVIWPDQDESGARYAEKVTELATKAGAVSVRIVDVPQDWPEGWDLADECPDGVTEAQLREMVSDALDGSPAEWAAGYRMTPEGLWFCPAATESNPEPAPIWIAAPFRVVGQTRNDVGEGWGLLLRWRDRERRSHQWAIPKRLIHRPGNEIAEELEHAGLSCGPNARAHDLLKRFVGAVNAPRLLRCVTRTGWHHGEAGPVFVLPGGEAFGRAAADVILQAEHASADMAYRPAGTLAAWQREVAMLAMGNDRLVLFTSAALAGPLLDIVGEPSGGVHLIGGSRIGKSTAAQMAASVWGKPTADAQMRAWRGTANGLEGAAADTTDTLLVLDEMGQADSREVGDVVYMLANEAGKQRSSRAGTARRRQSWRVLFLSTGEITLAQKMGEANRHASAGVEVRLVNLPADAGVGLGVFQNLHGYQNAGALADALRDAARRHHGTAARAFLARLAKDRVDNPDELRETLAELREAFLRDFLPAGATGQVRSVAGRFGLIAAAGELARDYGILPWDRGEAMRAAGACFRAWLGARGGAGPAEDMDAIAQVRAFIEAHGEARFTSLLSPSGHAEPAVPNTSRTNNRAGFRRRVPTKDGEEWEYLIMPEIWKREVCRGRDPTHVADLLTRRGWLQPGTNGKRAALVTIPGENKCRVYRVSGAILAGDEEKGAGDGLG